MDRPPAGNDRGMTIVKINAITVREGSGDELARRFAKRAGAVDDADGFEGFELLQPTDERDVWLVLTRWRDEASFDAWVSSPAFAHGHRGAGGHPGDGGTGRDRTAPVGAHSELWSYDIVDLPAARDRADPGPAARRCPSIGDPSSTRPSTG